MDQKAQAFLKALLSLSTHKNELLRLLPATLAEQVQNMPQNRMFDPASLFSPYYWAQHIHFSWFSDVIKEAPPQVRSLFLGALTFPQAKGVQQMLSISTLRPTPSPFLRPFLMHVLRNSLLELDILSEQLLPHSPLNCLLDFENRTLLHITDFLGIYDLAADMRQIVDKEVLKKIYDALTEKQRLFLQYCSQQPVKWVSPKIGLQAWNGSKKQLLHLVHYRGLIRLAKAIHGEDLNYKWHLLHRLDTGRAKVIQKELYRKQESALAPYFKNQVLHIAKRYQR